MEPVITAQMLAGALTKALDAAAGEAGRRGWAALVELIKRRRAARSQSADDRAQGSDDQAEGAGDQGQEAVEAPHSASEVGRLADWLAAQAEGDPQFARELLDWHKTVITIVSGQGDANNSVSGTVSGSVVQARDISGPITFGS